EDRGGSDEITTRERWIHRGDGADRERPRTGPSGRGTGESSSAARRGRHAGPRVARRSGPLLPSLVVGRSRRLLRTATAGFPTASHTAFALMRRPGRGPGRGILEFRGRRIQTEAEQCDEERGAEDSGMTTAASVARGVGSQGKALESGLNR